MTIEFQRLITIKSSATGDVSPAISVVVAVKNEMDNLPQFIQSLSSLNYQTVQFVVVDDNSTDSSFDYLQKIGGKDSRFVVIKNAGSGKKSALETGVNVASGDYILFTDADCVYQKDWLSGIAKVLHAEDPYLVVLPVTTHYATTLAGKVQELDFLSLIATTLGAGTRPFMCNGANLGVKKSVFIELDPYADNKHIPTGDDVFLLHAVKERYPSKISINAGRETWVRTSVKPNWVGFFEQRIRWGAKGINYSDSWTVMVACLVLFESGVVFGALVLGLLGLSPLWFLMFFTLKLAVDSCLLIKAARYFGKSYLIPLILPTSLFYILYVPVVALLGVVKNLLKFRK